MANVAKNAILRAKIEGVLTDIMVKTTAAQVYVNDTTTLAAHIDTLAAKADLQALQQTVGALGALANKDKVSYADLEEALAALIDGKAEASALTEEIARAKAAEEAAAAAASAAQAAADKAQGDVDGLKALVGELPEGATASTVVAYVDEKTAGIASDAALTAMGERVTAVEGEIDALAPVASTGSWNDLIDKPFYEEARSETPVIENVSVSWGKDEYPGVRFDTPITLTDGATYKIVVESTLLGETATETVEAVCSDGQCNFTIQNQDAVLTNDRLKLDSYSFAGSINSLSIYEVTGGVKTLDEKFIPDSIARVADQSAIADRVTAVEGLVGNEAVSKQISDAVTVEKNRAEGVESGLNSRLATVEGDYLKAADKTELEGKITANASAIELLTNGVSADEVDGVNDLINYVKEHGTEVTGMQADIKANADAIDALAPVASTGSWNDLVDKPFYEESEQTVVAYDGVYDETDDIVEIKRSNGNVYTTLVKVSNDTPLKEELYGATLETVTTTGTTRTTTLSETTNYAKDGEFVLFADNVLVVYATEFTYGGVAQTAPSTGLYLKADAVRTLTYGSVTVVALDEKFIPDTIARNADLVELNNRVTSAEGGIEYLQETVNGLGTMATKNNVAESDLDADLKAKVNAAAEGNHSHANKTVLDGITAEKVADWDDAVAKEHEHSNKTVIDGITAEKVAAWDGAVSKEHEHANAEVLNGITSEKVAAWDASEQNAKDYAKEYADGLNTAMDNRVKAVEGKAHEHANKTVIDGITSEKVAAWDAAEQNAKTHADGLNTAMDERMQIVEAAKHTHANKTVLDGITAETVASWNSKAKVYGASDTVDVAEGEMFIQLV